MIKVELYYNPYLLKTDIRFNGQPPRINSLVEKYRYAPLQNWIDQVPSIFHDEMNGYDFELEFSGTELDFAELKKSFYAAGVTDKLVKIFHKKELNGRFINTGKIDELLSWLENNPNHNFDYPSFREEYSELFDSTYPCIVMHGRTVDASVFDEKEISVETIDNPNELADTDLSNTPIIIYLNSAVITDIQDELKIITEHQEITSKQLLFILDPTLAVEKATRILRDIGIEHPQIVTDLSDEQISRYMELFPVSDYIFESIKAFSCQTQKIKEYLDEKARITAEKNKDIYFNLNSIKKDIENLKNARNKFESRDNTEMLNEWSESMESFLNSVKNWKIKKTKITKENDAIAALADFRKNIDSYYTKAVSEINNAAENYIRNLCDEFNNWFRSADVDQNHLFMKPLFTGITPPSFPDISDELLNKKTETIISHKDDLFDKIIKKHIDEDEIEIEITYYLHEWREYAASIAESTLNTHICNVFSKLCNYSDELSSEYLEHIIVLISEKEKDKVIISTQLSEEDKIIQDDTNWLAQFCDQLEIIKRG